MTSKRFSKKHLVSKITQPAHKVDYLRRDKLAWLLVTQALVILPLLFHLPAWLWLVWGLVAYWRVQMYFGRWGAPGLLLKAALVGASGLGILISFRGALSTETMVSLLLCAFVLKLLEVKSHRDAQLLVFIGFITSATQLLFNQTPGAALYCLICIWLLLGSWRAIYLLQVQNLLLGLKRSGNLLLHALPVMLVMFVVIPRLGPLWAIPNQKTSTTGFSDSLSPGDIDELVLSKASAFRVAFEGKPPAASQLYWRGLIMDSFDGRRWHLRERWGRAPKAQLKPAPQSLVNYSVILEPHGQQWLFALVTPISLDAGNTKARITGNYLLMTRQPVAQRLRYSVTSALALDLSEPVQLSADERTDNLRLPPQVNPRTRALAQSWRDLGLDDQAIIDRALSLFNRQFTYTLKPPPLGENAVDEFLFDTQRGFCEHFASSFAFLLRAAGVPARVVVGYQGGSWNRVENYLLVSQSDAHAWVEVWSPQLGWYTLDPTAAVAPQRIEQGIDMALSAEDRALVVSPWQNSALLRQLQLRWDAATYAWQRWVLNYDSESQQGLLRRWLGGDEPWRLTLWLIGLGLLGAGGFAWIMTQRTTAAPLPPEVRLIRRLERKLATRGWIRSPGTSLRDFIAQVDEPKLKARLVEICDVFEAIAYRRQTEKLARLSRQVRQL